MTSGSLPNVQLNIDVIRTRSHACIVLSARSTYCQGCVCLVPLFYVCTCVKLCTNWGIIKIWILLKMLQQKLVLKSSFFQPGTHSNPIWNIQSGNSLSSYVTGHSGLKEYCTLRNVPSALLAGRADKTSNGCTK